MKPAHRKVTKDHLAATVVAIAFDREGAKAPVTLRGAMPDLGLTHVALSVRDLDASIAFYERYARMAVVQRRAREGVRSAWLSDHIRPFVIVLVETAETLDSPLGPFGHLGVACASRDDIDQLYREATKEGRPTRAPIDAGEPIGYVARIADPDGNSLELSFGQEVGLTVEMAAPRQRF
jgi:lactoylglutathione lyase